MRIITLISLLSLTIACGKPDKGPAPQVTSGTSEDSRQIEYVIANGYGDYKVFYVGQEEDRHYFLTQDAAKALQVDFPIYWAQFTPGSMDFYTKPRQFILDNIYSHATPPECVIDPSLRCSNDPSSL